MIDRQLVIFSRGRFVQKSDGIYYYDNDANLIQELAETFSKIIVFGRLIHKFDSEYESASQYSAKLDSENICCFYFRNGAYFKNLILFIRLVFVIYKTKTFLNFGPTITSNLLNILSIFSYSVYYCGINWHRNSNRVFSLFEKLSINCASQVVTSGATLKKLFLSYGKSEVEIVRAPLKTAGHATYRSVLPGTFGFLRILSVGAISGRKNQLMLLKALLLLKKQDNKNFKATFCGQGNLEELKCTHANLISQIENNIEFKGHIKHACDLDHEYLQADVLVITSNDEGLPRVALEAMSHGLPVITTPLPAIIEDIPKNCIYDSVDFNDHVALAKCLAKASNDSIGLRQASKMGAEFYSDFYTESSAEMISRLLLNESKS